MDDEQVQDQKTQEPGGSDVDEEITAEGAAFVHGDPLQDYTGPPNSDSKVEILHDHVKKQHIKEGHGEKPTKYSTCFLHYRVWTKSTQHKFEDTWNEQRQVELIIGKDACSSHAGFIIYICQNDPKIAGTR